MCPSVYDFRLLLVPQLPFGGNLLVQIGYFIFDLDLPTGFEHLLVIVHSCSNLSLQLSYTLLADFIPPLKIAETIEGKGLASV